MTTDRFSGGSESGPAEPEGCCLSCHHFSHSDCLACGMSDKECLAKIWPESNGLPPL